MSLAVIYQQDFSNLVPHSGNMVLLDQVVNCNDEYLLAEITVRPDNLFYDANLKGIPGWVGIEWMAQSISAFSGIHRLSVGKSVVLGFLLGTREYSSQSMIFSEQLTYSVKVNVNMKDGDFSVFDCGISCGEKTVASATIKAYEPEDYQRYLAK